MSSPRKAFGSALALLLVLVAACARSPQTSTTTVTSAPIDVDTGACMCRLQEHEFLSCCRGGIELTCRCMGTNYGCNMVPTGRRCPGASAR